MQEAIILKFKRRAKQNQKNYNYDIKYDYKLGVYTDNNSVPIIDKYCEQNSSIGRTLLTETREGIDQCENSEINCIGETLITRSREGIDTSEVSA